MKMFLAAVALTIAVPAFAQTAAPAPMQQHGHHAAPADHDAGKDKAQGTKMDCHEHMKAEGKKMECCEKHDRKGAADAHDGHAVSNR